MLSATIILTWVATLFMQYKHDNTDTRNQLLRDAEKQCFDLPPDQRDCTTLNYVARQNLIKGMPLPVDLTRNYNSKEKP